MTDFEAPEIIKISAELRDRAWEHLPTQAHIAKLSVRATFWPLPNPDAESDTILTIVHNPHAGHLEIYVSEKLGETDYDDIYREVMREREVNLDSETGRVKVYVEQIQVLDEVSKVVPPDDDMAVGASLKVLSLDEFKNYLRQSMNDPIGNMTDATFNTFTRDKLNFIMGLFDNI